MMRYMLRDRCRWHIHGFLSPTSPIAIPAKWRSGSHSPRQKPRRRHHGPLQQFDQKADIANIRLGTTVATNALLKRTGATVAYVTTKGHRDVLFIQRGNRKFHYDMSWVKPKPLAKRRHCFEINRAAERRWRGRNTTSTRRRPNRGASDRGAARSQRGRGHAAVFLHQSGARTPREGDLRRGGARPAGVDFLRSATEMERI